VHEAGAIRREKHNRLGYLRRILGATERDWVVDRRTLTRAEIDLDLSSV
jgi:hypothetical protein